MDWKRDSLGTRLLAAAMSAVLVIGNVPVSAIAELVDETGKGQSPVVIVDEVVESDGEGQVETPIVESGDGSEAPIVVDGGPDAAGAAIVTDEGSEPIEAEAPEGDERGADLAAPEDKVAADEPVELRTQSDATGDESIKLQTQASTMSVSYYERSWDGSAVVSTQKTEEAVPVPSDGSMTSGWYYLDSNVTVDGRISLAGDTNLILRNGYTLDVKGIYVPQGSTLTIYGQNEDAGKINSHPSGGAAIGAYSGHEGGNVVIHGGIITAKGASHCAGIGSNDGNGTTAPITIYGGKVTATGGGDGAGIGGGRDCDGGTITIYGGTVTTKGGGENGAGIGGGCDGDGGTIKIYGGTITANKDPNEDGAAIGGGDSGDGGNVTISGGTVTTYSRDGAGIGGGDDGDGGTITINGGAVTCWDEGHAQGARIGGGCDGDGGTTTITGGKVDVYFRDGAGIGGGEDGDGGTINISGGTVTTHPEGVGNGAGIGGGNHSGRGGTITITGGVVTANGKNSAGIGGGRAREAGLLEGEHPNSGSGGKITITGGEVHAMSELAIAIGAGGDNGSHDYWNTTIGSAGTVTIGGDVKLDAYGRLGGIGGDSGTINIESGEVTVGGLENTKYGGYGIHLRSDDKGFVNISGGTVTAIGTHTFAGISTENARVTISGGTVDARSTSGAGIGARIDDSYNQAATGTLIIEGKDTVVTATSDSCGIGSKDSGKGTWIFRDGARIEVINRKSCSDNNVNILYKGARIIAGDTKENATALLAGERKNAYKNYKYRLIEPCDHPERDENGLCLYCENQEGTYIERSWDGTKVVSEEKSSPEGTLSFPKEKTVAGGWYFLNQNITIDGRVSLKDDTRLILGDGYTLDVKGLYIPQGKTLTVYSQSDGESAGRIVSHPTGGGAAIGGYSDHNNGDIVIHGGSIEATGDGHCAGIGSNDGCTGGAITIYGGTITAKGGDEGAAIGGGRDCDGGTITIYDGTITANGPTDSDCCENGAGIGGGQRGAGGTITINGGTIMTYSRDGAGIGGGDDGDGGDITINGGTVTSTKVNQGWGARIGGGCDAAPGTITINGGDITTDGGSGAGIGGGKGNTTGGTVTINGGVISASGDYGIGSGMEGADVSVTLGYTDDTKADISITTSTFGGTVTLNQRFYNSYGLFDVGVQQKLALLSRGTLKAWSGEVVTWENLQQLINSAENGSTITLERDYTAGDDDVALTIASGKSLTIDLNGHTLDYNAGDYNSDSVIKVQSGATLTINDSDEDGEIRGGKINKGGGIYCEGDLTLNGGSITENTATLSGGGGVYLAEGATFTMNGGSILHNTCSSHVDNNGCGGGVYCAGAMTVNDGVIAKNEASAWGGGIYLPDNTGAALTLNGSSIRNNTCEKNGGGVHVSGTAAITVSGEPEVKGNKKGAESNDLYLASGAGITVGGTLGDDADICVYRTAGIGTFTNGYSDYNTGLPSAFFSSDKSEYAVVLSDGEARLDVPVAGVGYVSYEWSDGRLAETQEETDDEWIAFPSGTTVSAGRYVLNEDVTVDDRVSLGGDTWIILTEGHTLDVKGLYVPAGSTLTVYADVDSQGETNTARLYSHPSGGAAIGAYSGHKGGNVVIHGGTIEAIGYNHCAGIGSNDGNGSDTGSFTMFHGTVTATGGSQGAGIGGGRDCDGGTIKIYGGTVTATGKDSSAGIGGSDASGTRADDSVIEIYGGTIAATGNSKGAGIGGGEYGRATVTISGGTVTGIGGSSGGAGIGSGVDGVGSDVTITGGSVTASSANSGGFGVGNGKNKKGNSTITLGWTDATYGSTYIAASSYSGAVKMERGFKDRATGEAFPAAGPVADPGALAGRELVPLASEPMFVSQSLTLGGQVGLNVYLLLPEGEGLDYTGSYVEFVVGGRRSRTIEAVIDESNRGGTDKSYYGFTLPLSSVEMAQLVTATFHYEKDGETAELSKSGISVKGYVEAFEADAKRNPGRYDDETVALVRAVADYGHWVQPFLSQANGWATGDGDDQYAEMTTHYAGPYDAASVAEALAGYGMSKDLGASSVAKATASLSLVSETALDVTLTVAEGTTPSGVAATIGGEAVGAVEPVRLGKAKGGGVRWRVRVAGIRAWRLGDEVVVTGDAGGRFSVSASGLAYAGAVLASGDFAKNGGHDAMCALVAFHDAEVAYRAKHS